jgi:hypothetical protein
MNPSTKYGTSGIAPIIGVLGMMGVMRDFNNQRYEGYNGNPKNRAYGEEERAGCVRSGVVADNNAQKLGRGARRRRAAARKAAGKS